MTMTRHELLVAIGPGGTAEIAERVEQLLLSQQAAMQYAPVAVERTELGGLAEVCTLLGESRQTVGHWISGRRFPPNFTGKPFPEPWLTLAMGPLYDLATVRQWGQSVGLSDLVPASA